jgi:hypothetical protein
MLHVSVTMRVVADKTVFDEVLQPLRKIAWAV